MNEKIGGRIMLEAMKIINMKELVPMLKIRQGDQSAEVFAVPIGIAGSTLRKYYTGLLGIGLTNGRLMIAHFEAAGDFEMANAIRSYLSHKMAI